ncbi:hypothetical protein CTAYLR_010445 [Chrysophaeum taylorii]|uniref:Mitochondrial carrier protein n=1 Tax=Chrysophaeum taylorii TaxID=2483200 RepID=A0AAD7U5X6_9STRA|nr:hypothetical protein CTAYLR_010445 [Chrysophaeum taylorii]
MMAHHELSDATITSISGTVAGLMATFAKQPIQRVKWIRQTSPVEQPYSVIFRETLQRYGWRGFFGGSLAAICRNVPHSVIVYSLYPHCAQLAREETFGTRFAAGYVTLILSTMATHPLDTLRVRLSVHPDTMINSATRIYKTDGIRGFYSGFAATLIGAGPRGAIGFAIFETGKPIAHDLLPDQPAFAKFLCGYLAGLVAESLVYPLDTVRRRQQALGPSHPIGRLSALVAIVRIAQAEGVSGLFKGIALNLVKNPAGTAVSFAVNDIVKEALGYEGGQHQPPSRTTTTTTKPSFFG